MRTTDYAIKRIQSHLDEKEYATALLLASIYVHMRLRSLLADRLEEKGDDWGAIHKSLRIDFVPAVRTCETLGLLRGQNPKNLTKLWDKRGSVAHESRLWRNPSEKDKEETKRLCMSAIDFLSMNRA